MNLVIVLLSFLVILSIFTAIFMIKNRKKGLRAGIIIVTFYSLICFLGFQYVTNQQFRLFVDLRLNPAKEHMLNLSNEFPLPLPPGTVFAYRGAHNSCTYFSERRPEEILDYFTKLGEISEQQGKSGAEYKLTYMGYSYLITVKIADSGKGSYLWVENMQS